MRGLARRLQGEVRLDPGHRALHQPVDGAPAQAERRPVVHRGDVADPPVPELEQVPHRSLGAALRVEAHGRMAAALGLDHDDRLGAGRAARRIDLEQQQAVGRPGPQRLGRGGAPGAVVVRVDQRDRVARGARGGLGAAEQPAEERVGDVRDDQRDSPGDPDLQRPRRGVRPVAELLGRGAHGRLGARGDPPGGLPREDQRHRRLRDAAPPRDVDAGDSLRAQACKLASPAVLFAVKHPYGA